MRLPPPLCRQCSVGTRQGVQSAREPGLGWVDFDFGFPPSCPAASAKSPSRISQTVELWNTQNSCQPNTVHEQMGNPAHALYTRRATVEWEEGPLLNGPE